MQAELAHAYIHTYIHTTYISWCLFLSESPAGTIEADSTARTRGDQDQNQGREEGRKEEEAQGKEEGGKEGRRKGGNLFLTTVSYSVYSDGPTNAARLRGRPIAAARGFPFSSGLLSNRLRLCNAMRIALHCIAISGRQLIGRRPPRLRRLRPRPGAIWVCAPSDREP